MKQHAIGIDIGGTNTKIAIVNSSGKVEAFNAFSTKGPSNFELFSDKVFEVSKNLLAELNLGIKDVKGVGVGAPNGNYISGKIVNPPNLKQWGTVDLTGPFKERFGTEVYLDNDANVAALGEGKWGKGKDKKDFVVVTLGTGIGTGVIVNNQLVRGGNGLAGEGGHISIDFQGRRCGCGGLGHLEMYGSVQGIKTTVLEHLGKELSFKEISEGYKAQDNEMVEVITITADYLGRGLSTMAALLSPQAFILAGGVSTLGQSFTVLVKESLDKYVFPTFKGDIAVELSEISQGEGAVLGAAALVL
ncbi:MAG: glucokinase [Halobacteriovoraceae bacterium]|nr:glucokinase [Halobacteriovoraceae bacterium]|tara:strand:- start:232116 stop:233024 length:909 start_codon:yes stop_codon:yes gene_type:complete